MRVSNLARAKETADIIIENMNLKDIDDDVLVKAEPDPCLNEGRSVSFIFNRPWNSFGMSKR